MRVEEGRERVLNWARQDENIRAVLETGALARTASTCHVLGLPDKLSDLDLELYAPAVSLLEMFRRLARGGVCSVFTYEAQLDENMTQLLQSWRAIAAARRCSLPNVPRESGERS